MFLKVQSHFSGILLYWYSIRFWVCCFVLLALHLFEKYSNVNIFFSTTFKQIMTGLLFLDYPFKRTYCIWEKETETVGWGLNSLSWLCNTNITAGFQIPHSPLPNSSSIYIHMYIALDRVFMQLRGSLKPKPQPQ